jgi:hypothetical protein
MKGNYESLMNHRRKVTSADGEDGLIEEVLQRVGATNKCCVELGANDGKWLSNIYHLWHDLGWKGLLIEGNREYYEALKMNARGRNVRIVNVMVANSGERTLDRILLTEGAPLDVDLLSLDVDGDDYYILESLNHLKPRLLIVEYNPTIPPHIDIVQEPGEHFGASAAAIVRLGHEKGYRFICLTHTNCFLLREDVFPSMHMREPKLDQVFRGTELTYVISSYHGQMFLSRQPTYVNRLENEPLIDWRKFKRSRHSKLAGRDRATPVRIFNDL